METVVGEKRMAGAITYYVGQLLIRRVF